MLPASHPPSTSPMLSSSSTLWATASKEWVIPPKPKPGRKPKKEAAPSPEETNNEQDSKGRRVQNRAAQRAFRERKQSQLAELQARIQLYEQGEIERNVALQNVAKRLKEENEALRAENASLKEQVARLEVERSSSKENDNKRARDNTPASAEYSELPATKKAKLAVDAVSLQPSRSASVAFMSSPPSMVSSPDSLDTSESSYSPMQLNSPANDDHVQSTQIALESMFEFPSSSKSTGYDAVSSLGHFDCGFCNEHTPCVCREIALNQVNQMSTDPVFKVEDDRMDDFSLRPAPVSILENLPAYQPAVPLRRRPTNTPTKVIFPVVKQVTLEPAPTSSTSTVPANCSGDPSNCPACADDVFGKAFCTAIGQSVESAAPCAGCPGSGRGCCGGSGACANGPCSASSSSSRPERSADTIPTNDAWRQIKSHPNVEFADLALLAEVVAGRSKCTGPRIILSPPPSQPSDPEPAPADDDEPHPDSSAIILTDPHAQYKENQQKRNLSLSPPPKLVPHEELLECGRRRGPIREVHAGAVREALRLLDAKFGSS